MSYRANSDFVYTDLSSYDTGASRRFYREVFGWKTYDLGKMPAPADDRFGMGDVSYYIATVGSQTAAGIFDMPPFFQKIQMPPFWMSYVTVDNINEVVERAKAIEGAIIDVEPTPFGDGMMALIRDPLGAGFTCYEGPSIDCKGNGSECGRVIWNELFTSSIAEVEQFYRTVLGFDLVPDGDFQRKRVKLINMQGDEVAAIQEMEPSIRGEKVYWMPFFGVDDLSAFASKVNKAGGTLLYQEADSGLFNDCTGAAFGVTELPEMT